VSAKGTALLKAQKQKTASWRSPRKPLNGLAFGLQQVNDKALRAPIHRRTNTFRAHASVGVR
jgi:hypothetical protein